MALFIAVPHDDGDLNESHSSGVAYPEYRITPVWWRKAHAPDADRLSIDPGEPCLTVVVNLGPQAVRFSSPRHELPSSHFSVFEAGKSMIEAEGPGNLIAIDVDSLPPFPKRSQKLVRVHPVPSAATSLIDSLGNETREVSLPLLVRALTELLSPSLQDGIEESEFSSFRTYVSTHLGESISTEDMASAIGLSANRLRKMTHNTIGMTPVAYLREERTQLARDLLATTTIPIEQIAERTGYSDRFAFSRAFTASTRMSPNAFRESRKVQES